MKKINMEAMSGDERSAALKEVELLKHLNHSCIVSYVDHFLDGHVLCLVMEYCSGGDLAEAIKLAGSTPFEESQVLSWFCQLALALQHCHSQRVLHRDLKTKNVYLTDSKQIKLGDFGIARVLESTLELATSVVGTPYTMSPEVCNSAPYSYKSDIWALGCVLFEMCQRDHAFNGNNLLALVWKIVKEEPPPLDDHYSPELRELTTLLLCKDPNLRPSIDQILDLPIVRNHLLQVTSHSGHLQSKDADQNQTPTRTASHTPDTFVWPISASASASVSSAAFASASALASVATLSAASTSNATPLSLPLPFPLPLPLTSVSPLPARAVAPTFSLVWPQSPQPRRSSVIIHTPSGQQLLPPAAVSPSPSPRDEHVPTHVRSVSPLPRAPSLLNEFNLFDLATESARALSVARPPDSEITGNDPAAVALRSFLRNRQHERSAASAPGIGSDVSSHPNPINNARRSSTSGAHQHLSALPPSVPVVSLTPPKGSVSSRAVSSRPVSSRPISSRPISQQGGMRPSNPNGIVFRDDISDDSDDSGDFPRKDISSDSDLDQDDE